MVATYATLATGCDLFSLPGHGATGQDSERVPGQSGNSTSDSRVIKDESMGVEDDIRCERIID